MPHVDAHHILHRVRVWLRQCAVPLPESHDADFEEVIHQLWELHILLQFTRRVLERVVVVVLSVRFSELLQEVLISHVDALGTVCEIGEPVVALSLCVDDFIACLFDQVCLVPPQVIRFLELGIAPEEARPILLHVVVEESLSCHSSIVAFWHLIIIRHVQFILRFSKIIMQIFVAELLSYRIAQQRAFGCQLFVKASANEQANQKDKVEPEREQNRYVEVELVETILFVFFKIIAGLIKFRLQERHLLLLQIFHCISVLFRHCQSYGRLNNYL